MGLIDRVASQIAASPTPLDHEHVVADARRRLSFESPLAGERAVEDVADALLGLGPVQRLLRDPDVSDVLVNGPDEIWVERRGELELTDVTFPSAGAVVTAVERVIGPLGLRVDRSRPMVEARLPDGSRLHAVIPPASVTGPFLAVRRFTQMVTSLGDLVEAGSASAEQHEMLSQAVSDRRTMVVAGGTGTGKTTLLNLLAGLVSPSERIVTIEDAAELSLAGHVVRLEARPPNTEGVGAITIRQLLASALRLRPDRIIVGEVRGAEALDLIWALNTGHDGSMSTVHANSAPEALMRLETLALSAGTFPAEVVRRQLTTAVDLVIELARHGGERRIAGIHDVADDGTTTRVA